MWLHRAAKLLDFLSKLERLQLFASDLQKAVFPWLPRLFCKPVRRDQFRFDKTENLDHLSFSVLAIKAF